MLKHFLSVNSIILMLKLDIEKTVRIDFYVHELTMKAKGVGICNWVQEKMEWK